VRVGRPVEGHTAEIHAEVCRNGYDPDRNTFTQSYGSREPGASLLLIPLVGFLPAADLRVRGTIAAIQRELVRDGFVLRFDRRRRRGRRTSGRGGRLPGLHLLADPTIWRSPAAAG
jgi:GH15 family glucan-1,4-alpha-glucosidase